MLNFFEQNNNAHNFKDKQTDLENTNVIWHKLHIDIQVSSDRAFHWLILFVKHKINHC